MNIWVPLLSRYVCRLSGQEGKNLLHGISTNDIKPLSQHNGVFTAFLNRQGRFLADAFVFYHQEHVWLDYDISHHDIMQKLFVKYGPLHDVKMQKMPWIVFSLSGPESEYLYKPVKAYVDERSGVLFKDPRHISLGFRVVMPYVHWHELPHPLCVPGQLEQYRVLCIQQCIPSGAHDLIPERSLILEYNYHMHNGLSWNKGCYVGQEVIARSFHQNRIRKGLFCLTHIKAPFIPKAGQEVFDSHGNIQGVWGSVSGDQGLICLDVSWALEWANTPDFQCFGPNKTIITGKLVPSTTFSLACPEGA